MDKKPRYENNTPFMINRGWPRSGLSLPSLQNLEIPGPYLKKLDFEYEALAPKDLTFFSWGPAFRWIAYFDTNY